ncbi:NfeD family protein [Spirochaeta dissipatitropha]
MKSIIFAVLLLFSFPYHAAGESAQVFVIPIKGDIEPSTAIFVQRRINEALERNADILIFTIDTFGGRVDSALQTAAAIGAVSQAETIAFVTSGSGSMGVSWSAGALIAMASSAIYMSPGTSIGAAAPVMASPDGTSTMADEKSVSAVRTQMAALAEKNGYPVSLALAMVDSDIKLFETEIDGRGYALPEDEMNILLRQHGMEEDQPRLLIDSGKLLSLTAGEAERLGLSSGSVFSIDELLLARDIQSSVLVELRPDTADRAIVILSSAVVQSLLILIALVAVFMEVNAPGFGLPGAVAIIAFSLLFGTSALMGTMGSFEIILFLLGLSLLVIEIFVLPGFGIAGIGGLALLSASIILSMQAFVIPDTAWEWDILIRNSRTVGIGLGLGFAAIALLVTFGAKLRLFDRLTLKTFISDTASGRQSTEDHGVGEFSEEGLKNGDQGIAISTLRPAGTARFGGKNYSVESISGFLTQGTAVRVAGFRGSVIYVESLED